MKITAPEAAKVLRSLIRAGLTEPQAQRILNRALLCLNYIRKGRRLSSDMFKCFQGELRVSSKRMRFQQLLTNARLIKKTKPHIAGSYSPEYACRGKLEERQIEVDELNAQIRSKLQKLFHDKQGSDETLQWLKRSIHHRFEDGRYTSLASTLGWPKVDLNRLRAAIVAKALEDKFQKELEHGHKRQTHVTLDHGEEGFEIFDAQLSSTRELFETVSKFTRQRKGHACTDEDLAELDHGRLESMMRKEGFKQLAKSFRKRVICRTVELLKEREIKCAVDAEAIYCEDLRKLEAAFVLATDEVLSVNISLY